MVTYYALWIPTLSSSPIDIPKEPHQDSLTDVPGQPELNIRSEVSGNSYDIRVFYTLSYNRVEREILFEHIEHNHSGLIIYKLEHLGRTDALIDELDRKMHPAVYNFLKEHFHRHQFHAPECDSLLRPFVSPTVISLRNSSQQKAIYAYYLKQYLDKISSFNESISYQLARLEEDINRKKFYYTGLQDAKRIKKEADRNCGEAAYARALLNMSKTSVSSNLYQKLFNEILLLDTLDGKCRDTYNLINNNHSNRLGMWGIIFGVAGIFITLGLEIKSCVNQNTTKNEFEENFLRKSNSELRDLKNRADSLNKVNEGLLNHLNNN